MNALTNGISIYVIDTDKTYHTLNDWGFALSNNNYIGDPEMETTYISIPGRDNLLDASESLTGRRVYKKRALAFNLGGVRERLAWDSFISMLRNEIQGRVCHLTIDNDPSYFWKGRVYIEGFDRFQKLGAFTLAVPTADPYKYGVLSSSDPWLWDPFNFETDMITYIGAITVNGTATVTIPHGYMPTCPEFVVSEKTSGTFTVTYDGDVYDISQAVNRIPSIVVGGDQDVTLTFTGTAKVEIVYRSGSL